MALATYDERSAALAEVQPETLEGLAGYIHRQQDALRDSASETLVLMDRIGRGLLAAQEKVPHGQWQEWVRANCDMAVTTARRYMRFARLRPALPSEAENLSRVDALAMLEGLPAPAGYSRKAAYPEEMHAEVRRLRDQGMTTRQIAAELGIAQVTVSKWLRSKAEQRRDAERKRAEQAQRSAAWRREEIRRAADKRGGDISAVYSGLRQMMDRLHRTYELAAGEERLALERAYRAAQQVEDEIGAALRVAT